MPRFTTRVSAFLAALVVGCAWTVSAQTNGADPDFARMREKLKTGDRVTVSLLDGTTVKGRFAESSSDEVAVSTNTGERLVKAGDIARVQRTRTGVVLGTLIGGGVGVALGTAAAEYANNETGNGTQAFIGATLMGVGVGALIDALVNFPRTVYKRSSNRVAMRIDTAPKRAAVGITLAF